jgi:hypothetical protein
MYTTAYVPWAESRFKGNISYNGFGLSVSDGPKDILHLSDDIFGGIDGSRGSFSLLTACMLWGPKLIFMSMQVPCFLLDFNIYL